MVPERCGDLQRLMQGPTVNDTMGRVPQADKTVCIPVHRDIKIAHNSRQMMQMSLVKLKLRCSTLYLEYHTYLT